MGIFNNNAGSRNRPQYLDDDYSGLTQSYSTLFEALSDALFDGSKDVKKTEFAFGTRIFNVYSIGSVIKGITDSYSKLNLTDRLYWENEATKANLTLSFSATGAEFDYNKVVAELPQHIHLVNTIYQNYALEAAAVLDLFVQKSKKVRPTTDILLNAKLSKEIETWEFLNTDAETLKVNVSLDHESVEYSANMLNVDLAHTDKFKLKTITDSEKTVVDDDAEILFLLGAATNEANLSQVKKLSSGFRFSSVLQSLSELAEADVVQIVDTSIIPAAPEDSAFDLAEEDDKPVQPIDESLPEFEDDSEWIFENVEPEVEEKEFDFDEEVQALLARYNIAEENVVIVNSYLTENRNLEFDISEINDRIAPLAELYQNGMNNYKELQVEKIDLDDSDVEEKNPETVNDDPEIINQRRESHSEFFSIEKFEELRFEKNARRKKILYGILRIVPFEESDKESVVVHNAIENKIAEINNIDNIAFDPSQQIFYGDNEIVVTREDFVPEEENLETVVLTDDLNEETVEDDSAEGIEDAEEVVNSRIIDLDSSDELDPYLNAIYIHVVNDLGFDPILDYKKKARLLRDGIATVVPNDESNDVVSEGTSEDDLVNSDMIFEGSPLHG